MDRQTALQYGYEDLGDGDWFDPADGTVFLASDGQWHDQIATMGPGIDSGEAEQTVIQAASEGWNIGELSNNLLSLGYTAAQLAMLYQNVRSSSQATPQVLSYLQQENAALQVNSASKNQMLMWAAIGVGVLVLVMGNRRQAAA